METPALVSSVSERGVATLTLNRPERGNACHPEMLRAALDCLTTFRDDTRVRVLVLRGSGKHFCTGADMKDKDKTDRTDAGASFHEVISALDAFPKPTISVVHGGAIGGGAGLAVACDTTIMDEQAFFSIPEVRFGTVPDAIARVIIRAMGERNFRRYALSGERIEASEAQRIGLAQKIFNEAQRDGVVDNLIDALLLGAPQAQAATKRLAFGEPFTDADSIAAERREGAAAFRERRKPAWYPNRKDRVP